jgi:hypothetical protein
MVLNGLGANALPKMCETFADPHPYVRGGLDSAIRNIAFRADEGALMSVMKLLSHTNGEVRAEAAVVFTQVKDVENLNSPSWIKALAKMTNDSFAPARQEATFALWRITRDTNQITRLIAEFQQARDTQTGSRILDYFGSMPPEVKPAQSVISTIVNNSVALQPLSNRVWRLYPEVFE